MPFYTPTQPVTAQELEVLRRRRDAMRNSMAAAPPPTNLGEGIAAFGQGLGVALMNRRLNSQFPDAPPPPGGQFPPAPQPSGGQFPPTPAAPSQMMGGGNMVSDTPNGGRAITNRYGATSFTNANGDSVANWGGPPQQGTNPMAGGAQPAARPRYAGIVDALLGRKPTGGGLY